MGEIVEVLDWRVEKMGEEIRSVVLYPGSEVVKDKVGILVQVRVFSPDPFLSSFPPFLSPSNSVLILFLAQLIKDIIQQWALTACTPTPSEASDAVTLCSDDNPDHLNMIMTSSTWTALPIPPPPTPEQLPMAHHVQEEHVDPLKTVRPVLATGEFEDFCRVSFLVEVGD